MIRSGRGGWIYSCVWVQNKIKGNTNRQRDILQHHKIHPACTHFTFASSVQCHFLFFPPPLDHGVIRSDRVFDAMLATDRGLYSSDYPYADSPQSIGIPPIQSF